MLKYGGQTLIFGDIEHVHEEMCHVLTHILVVKQGCSTGVLEMRRSYAVHVD